MKRFIFVTFAFMGWGFYELSGGSDFQAGSYTETASVASAVGSSGSGSAGQVDVASMPEGITALNAGSAAGFVSTKGATALDSAQTEAVADTPRKKSLVMNAAFGTDEPTPAVKKVVFDRRSDYRAETGGVMLAMRDVDHGTRRDIREVAGSRVNMRDGPGTSFPVLSTLDRGDEVIVLQSTGDGWLKLKVVETNRIGWMADFLVTAAMN